MTKLQRLIIVGAAVAFALECSPARAGMPMMDDPILLSVRGESCTGVCNMKIKPKQQGSGAGSQGMNPYKTYRDRTGFGSLGNGAPRLRR
jgi:hypothetical protein